MGHKKVNNTSEEIWVHAMLLKIPSNIKNIECLISLYLWNIMVIMNSVMFPKCKCKF